ncbi:MAG: Dabb family protein [Acidiferrobacterales bacterium]|nr:Dabb family protein [Acidiferrobacterales bacterium]
MIRHILLVRFKSTASSESIATVEAAFQSIASKIEGIDSVEWGENNSQEGKNQGFTHCVLMTFVNEEARDLYLPHPEHLALIDIFRPTIENIIVFDYRV